MTRLFLDRDIRPLSEFRANAAALIEQVKETGRPLVITQHGRGSAVVLDVAEYERLMQKLELLENIQIAEQQIAEGKGIPHEEARERLLKRFSK